MNETLCEPFGLGRDHLAGQQVPLGNPPAESGGLPNSLNQFSNADSKSPCMGLLPAPEGRPDTPDPEDSVQQEDIKSQICEYQQKWKEYRDIPSPHSALILRKNRNVFRADHLLPPIAKR